MGFMHFHAAIKSAPLRAVASHWNSARGTKRLPSWKDIDPAAIGPHLPIVWSLKYDKETDTFTGRLAGEKIIRAFGQNPRGKRMRDFLSSEHHTVIFPQNKRAVSEPAFIHSTGQVFRYLERYNLGERIVMPLATDGSHGDGILGATLYPINEEMPFDATAAQNEDMTHQVFFALD